MAHPRNPRDVFREGVRVLDRYRVQAPLGSGGMALVFRAADEHLDERTVVLKVPFAGTSAFDEGDLRKRFRKEISHLIRLGHVEGVVDILDQGEHEGCPFYVAKWMRGGSLGDKLRKVGRQTPDEVAVWLGPVAAALDAIHRRELVHRDVKPDNILFTHEDPAEATARLADFGIARVYSAGPTGVTARYTSVGTMAYWAPEQAAGKPLDGRADQFSLAATAYHALTGQAPAIRGLPARIRALAPSVSALCEAAVHRGMEIQHDSRYDTCGAFERTFVQGIPRTRKHRTAHTLRRPPVPQGPGKSSDDKPVPGRWKWLAVPIGLALVGLALHVTGALSDASESPNTTRPDATPTEVAVVDPAPAAPVVERTPSPPPDVQPPALTVTSPATDPFETTAARVVIEGTVQDESPVTLTSNGELVDTQGGAFAHPMDLAVGQSVSVTLIAKDAHGNESAPRSLTLIRKPPRWAAPLAALQAAVDSGRLGEASRLLDDLLDSKPPANTIPAKLQQRVLTWRAPPDISVAKITAQPVKDPRPVLRVHWRSARTTDRLYVQGVKQDGASPGPRPLEVRLPHALMEGTNTVAVTVRDGSQIRWEHSVAIAYRGEYRVEVPSWAKVSQDQIAEAKRYRIPVAFENNLGMRFVLIPSGTFTMGSPKDEEGRDDDETRHRVTLTQPYYMAIHEVTNAQYKSKERGHPYRQRGEGELDDFVHNGRRYPLDGHDQPVVWVSHNHATRFVKWLNNSGGSGAPRGTRYALPTEAQWERAARGGSAFGRYFWEPGTAHLHANTYDARTHAMLQSEGGPFPMADRHRASAPVGSYLPNRYGLYDTLGNVWEWCADWYGEYPGDRTDPGGPPQGQAKHYARLWRWKNRKRATEGDLEAPGGPARVARGGCWNGTMGSTRLASRSSNFPPTLVGDFLGFRLAATAPEPQ